ncbi:MAG: hypothetical protein GY719_23250 [bacterium]|nr:hypothetical protein [bacterium]
MSADRSELEAQLRTDLLEQSYLHEWHTGNLEQLQALETRIQRTAERLRPDSPEAAILAARSDLTLNELGERLLRRAQLPLELTDSPEPVRVRERHLERRILDLARELEPPDPRAAIDSAMPIARRQLSARKDFFTAPTPELDQIERRLPEIARRLATRATGPRPTQLQRFGQDLAAVRRLDQLDAEGRRLVGLRQHMAFGGNVYELQARLEKIPEVRAELYESIHRIYRDPGSAIEAFEASIRRQGRRATIERFGEGPAAFGELRGRRLPWLGNTPQRKRALDLAWHNSGLASTALDRRESILGELEGARRLQRLQARNRELQAAYPSRERLLADLGRHMEGLGLDEVRPLLQPGRRKMVEELRDAEQRFLEPLRAAAGKFAGLDARALAKSAVRAEAQRVAALFQYAPGHILRRLTPPQMQGALAAVAVARRLVESAGRSVAV